MFLTYTGEILCALGGNTFATGRVGYATNILVACTMVHLAVVMTVLAGMEHGIPQPEPTAD